MKLKDEIDPLLYARLLAWHDAIFRDALAHVEAGRIIQDTGDGFVAEFRDADSAVRAALLF
jgi:hypothetical protein